MSFSGKKYRRVRTENTEELVKISQQNKRLITMLTGNAPTFCYTRIDKERFNFTLVMDDKVKNYDFKLNEEHIMEKIDGTNVKITYILENDNVLKQKIVQKDGKVVYFTREFGEKDAKMTITIEGTNINATVYYEQVE